MTGNLMPWIIMALIVLASLIWKGYVKMPPFSRHPQAMPPAGPAPLVPGGPSISTSTYLGVLFAQAVRREAEEEIAGLIAKQAQDSIKATFQAPFSPPAASPPAGGAKP